MELRTRKHLSSLILLALLIFLPALVQAHAQWLLTPQPAAAPGDSVTIELGSGHAFPVSEMAEEPDDARVQVIDPAGQRHDLEMEVAGTTLRGSFMPQAPGAHRVFFGVERGQISRTEEGWQDGNRSRWPEADMCLDYFIGAMTFVSVGDGPWRQDPLGLPLEVQVEENGPAGLKLRAYLRGEPAPELGLRIWRKGEGFVTLGATDAAGRLEVTEWPTAQGKHLISATYRHEMPEGSPCDEELYRFNIVVDRP